MPKNYTDEFNRDDISPEGLKIVRGLLAAADPKNNFDPGKIIGAEGAAVPAAKAVPVRKAKAATKATVVKPAPAKKAATKAPAKKAPSKVTPTK